MDISKYIPQIKLLTIIPIIVGCLTIIEIVLPYKMIDTEVISKESTYRLKTDRTTYNVNFRGIDDQFTEEIYNMLSKGDKVELFVTYFNKQIRELKLKNDNRILMNSTLEPYVLYMFALGFLLTTLAWIRKESLRESTAPAFLIIIFISSIQLIRMFI